MSAAFRGAFRRRLSGSRIERKRDSEVLFGATARGRGKTERMTVMVVRDHP